MKVYQSILGVSFLLLSIWGVLAETETPIQTAHSRIVFFVH